MSTIILWTNYISSIATLILFIHLCFKVSGELKKQQNSTEKTDEASNVFHTSMFLIKEKTFKRKGIALLILIAINIITNLFI